MWQGAGAVNVARSTSRIWLSRCLFIGLGLAIGFGRVLAVQLPIIVVASILGVWLCSVQHRFEHTLWVHDANWSFTEGALRGSSYLRLPRILQWSPEISVSIISTISIRAFPIIGSRIATARLAA